MIPREELLKEKSQSMLIAMIYAEIYSRVRQKFDQETAAEKLKEFGKRIARSYYEYYKPSKSSISGIARELSDKIGGMKKIKLKKLDDGFSISSNDCPLCVPEITIEGLHYCYPTMGILEEYLNLIIRDNPRKFRYERVIGSVVQSKSCGAEICEYRYKLIEK
ncbi:MAG: hypothetical protein HWN65_01595 [Candidatus Helarchaeota archaeon]|nr:hypothetical protein [Candidatus Helarchaeota archaeon]